MKSNKKKKKPKYIIVTVNRYGEHFSPYDLNHVANRNSFKTTKWKV